MEVSNAHNESSRMNTSAAQRSAEIAKLERIRDMERELQAQVELRARSPEQSAGQIVDLAV